MNSMQKKLFWSALSVSMAVLFVTLLVGFSVIFRHFREVGDPRTVWQLLEELLIPALLIASLIVPVCLLLSWRLSLSITTPLNRLQLENPKKDAVSFRPLVSCSAPVIHIPGLFVRRLDRYRNIRSVFL